MKKEKKGKLFKMANGELLLGKKVLVEIIEKAEKVLKRQKRQKNSTRQVIY